MDTRNIYVVEDEREISDFVTRYLKKEGFNVSCYFRGDEALDAILETPPDLVILDIMLPGLDGLEVLRKIRSEIYLPVILLTSKTDEMDRIIGLELGADDYISKPFSPRELTARVKSLFRRIEAVRNESSQPSPAEKGIGLDRSGRKLIVNGNPVNLTSIEFAIIKLMMSSPGRVYSRENLLDLVWGEEFIGETRTVDVHVKNLRKKIREAGGNPDVIRAVWGVGYTFED